VRVRVKINTFMVNSSAFTRFVLEYVRELVVKF
jgi:hypothetical protein